MLRPFPRDGQEQHRNSTQLRVMLVAVMLSRRCCAICYFSSRVDFKNIASDETYYVLQATY